MRSGWIIGGLFALCAGAANAQSYPAAAPVPRTTDAPTLRSLATAREIHERFRLGLEHEAASRWDRAIPEFERIIALRPAEPQLSTAYYDVSIAYARSGRLDEASKALHAALTLDPQFLAAMANAIAVDIQRNDLAGARAIADRFIALAPDSARALYQRGLLALRQNDVRTAADDFGKLLQRNPSYAIAHYDLGLAEVKLARLEDARREFEAALALAPSYARAQFALAGVFLRQGQKPQARALFSQVARTADDLSLRNLAAAMRDSIAQ